MTDLSGSILVPAVDSNRLFDRHKIPAAQRQQECELVAPGCFRVKSDPAGFLNSYLGAGVGVALYDKAAGVGGIIHFLLEEPIGRSAARHPEHYARSGLQHFIDALVAEGAQVERMKASVAGGILLGQPSDYVQDLEFGKMTSDAVLQQLSQQQIPLEQLAVGGLSPCSLLLDTARWQVTIEQFSSLQSSSDTTLPVKPSQAKIDQLIAAVKPLPQIAVKIMQLLGQESVASFSSLAEEVKKDQIVTSLVLRHCNSPILGFSQNIASIDRALVLLGENNLIEIVVSAAVDYIYSDQDKGYALLQGGLYKHALTTAHVAKEIAEFTGWVDQGQAYTAGLVHDIGKIILNAYVADSMPFFYQHLAQKTEDFCVLENRLFDIDHTGVGAQLAQQWNLPESLTAVIRHHHAPQGAPEDCRMLVNIVYLADLLTSHYLAGVELERINPVHLDASLAAVGLRASQLPLIIDTIPWENLMSM